VLLDATLIRSMLLPASMILLDIANWYLPRWLGWLSRVTIESTAPVTKRTPVYAD
jgi:RND superfamily putative drug exporter